MTQLALPVPNELTDAELAALRKRHHAAVRLLPQFPTVEARWDLLAAVVWPEDERLLEMAA